MRRLISLLLVAVMLFALTSNLFACTFEMRDPMNPSGNPNRGEEATVVGDHMENVRPDDTAKEEYRPETAVPEPETESMPLASYMVSFILEGSAYEIEPQKVMEGEYARKPDVWLESDVRFDGVWYLDPSFREEYRYDFDLPVCEDLVLYARVEVMCTVSFVVEGNKDQPKPQTVWPGECIQYPDFVLDEYNHFDGNWYLHPSCIELYRYDFNEPVSKDLVLYAKVTRDPSAPALMFDSSLISEQISNGWGILSADTMQENGVDFVRLMTETGDPAFTVGIDVGIMPNYLAFMYRTNSDLDGEMFIGSANGPNGQNDHVILDWNGDGNWNLLIVDLANSTCTNITDGYIGYFRFDPFRDGTEDYIDIAYIGFFDTAEYAILYDATPALLMDATTLADKADTGNLITVERKEGFIRLSAVGGDPFFQFISDAGVMPQFLAISYRTNSDSNGEFFIGSGMGPHGGTDEVYVDWNGDGKWNLAVIDLTAVEGLTSIVDGIINYCRLDFLVDQGAWGDYFDISYVGFFDSVADAEAYYSIMGLQPKDIKSTFRADVYSQGVGTTLDGSDLASFFTVELPLGSEGVIQNGGGKIYSMTAISDMYADVNGKYFLKANNINSHNGWMFVRGYSSVNSDELIMKADPTNDIYLINNFYETDGSIDVMGDGYGMGGAGVYARIESGFLYIVVKQYDPKAISRVGNRVFTIPCSGTELTMADDGENIYILVNGGTMATIHLEGTIVYTDINDVGPKNGFAKKATVMLADGTVTIIDNTLVAETCECQIGVVVRGGEFKFDSLEVGAYSSVNIPEMVMPTHAQMPSEFTLSLYQANLGKELYFTGAMSGYYLATTDNFKDAVVMYSEAFEDGYRMYFLDGGIKQYVEIHEYVEGKQEVRLTDTPTTHFVWHADANTWVVWIESLQDYYYLGTYNNFDTISASRIVYITGDRAPDVGISQFVMTWNEIQ